MISAAVNKISVTAKYCSWRKFQPALSAQQLVKNEKFSVNIFEGMQHLHSMLKNEKKHIHINTFHLPSDEIGTILWHSQSVLDLSGTFR